jgi:alpha-D-xyloside xylohydrolase
MSLRTDRPDYDFSEDVILKVFQLENGRQLQVEIPDLSGNIETVFAVRRENDLLRIERKGSSKPCKVLLVNVESVESEQSFEKTPEGLLLSLEASLNVFEVKIEK